MVLSFLIGAYTCGLLIDKNQIHFLGKAFYGLALVLNSTLLVLAAFVPGRLLPACFVSAACGLQNAMCTSHFGAIIRTTHVTGTMTDIGSTLGRISMIYLRKGCRRSRLDDVERAEVGVDARKFAVLFGLWCFFFMGGILGINMETGLDSRFFNEKLHDTTVKCAFFLDSLVILGFSLNQKGLLQQQGAPAPAYVCFGLGRRVALCPVCVMCWSQAVFLIPCVRVCLGARSHRGLGHCVEVSLSKW